MIQEITYRFFGRLVKNPAPVTLGHRAVAGQKR